MKTASPLTPIQIARIALIRMSEKGLPPTPDNYRHFYHEAAGTQAPMENQDLATIKALISAGMLVNDITDTTASLVTALEGHNDGLKTSIDSLRQRSIAQNLLEAIGEILTTAVSLHHSVDESHGELRLMRDTLHEIRQELASRHHLPENDPLTGAKSPYALDGILRHAIARAGKQHTRLSIVAFDLDRFHDIHDQFGGTVADKLLAHIGEVTRSSLRENDVLIRFDGEEFLIVMPETEINGARFVVDRLQLILQKTPMIHNGQRLSSPFSAGITQFITGERAEDLIERARHTLQAAKTVGHGSVRIAEPAAQ